MSNSLTTENLEKIFTYPFKSERAGNKWLIGGLLAFFGFLLIPMLPLYGYCLAIMRRIIVDDAELSLPEWDDWGKLFVDGLKLIGMALIFMLPAIILLMLGGIVMFGTMFLPLFAIPFVGDGEGVMIAASMLSLVGMMGGGALMAFGGILAMIIGLFIPAAMGHMVAKDDFGAAFRFKEWWGIFRANWGGFLIAYVLLMIVVFIISFFIQFLYMTIICCCLIPFIMAGVTMYQNVLWATLFAQAYQDGVKNQAKAQAETTQIPATASAAASVDVDSADAEVPADDISSDDDAPSEDNAPADDGESPDKES